MVYDAPMKNPRITITLKPEVHAIIKELSRLNDESQSAIIGSMLEHVSPVLTRMVSIMQAAEQAKDAVRGRLVGDMEAAQAKVEKSLGIVMAEFEAMEQPFLDLFDDVKRRAPKAAATPPSNRGVRSLPKTHVKQARMRPTGQLAEKITVRATPTPPTPKKQTKKPVKKAVEKRV